MKLKVGVVPAAIAFEGALGAVAAILCWQFAIPLGSRLAVSWQLVARGLGATAPMLLLLAWSTRTSWRPIAELRRQVKRLIGELFRGASLLELAAVSVAAGVGEELLFRGALQPLAERWWGPVVGLATASLLFGAAHAASITYFTLATAVGFYLGWLSWRYEELVTPIVVHSVYDFAALTTLLRRRHIDE